MLRDLATEGRTVFVSSHLINEMSLTADRLVVIGRGTLIAETSVEEFTAQSTGQAVRVSYHDMGGNLHAAKIEAIASAGSGGGSTSDEKEAAEAKHALRASGLPALPPDNVHVAKDLKKVANGKKLSPVLLVRGEPTLIADGYHRVCASYHLNENEDIPSRIVNRNMSE